MIDSNNALFTFAMLLIQLKGCSQPTKKKKKRNERKEKKDRKKYWKIKETFPEQFNFDIDAYILTKHPFRFHNVHSANKQILQYYKFLCASKFLINCRTTNVSIADDDPSRECPKDKFPLQLTSGFFFCSCCCVSFMFIAVDHGEFVVFVFVKCDCCTKIERSSHTL